MYDLTVVIINYQTPDMLVNCLVSLMPNLDGISSKVIVIDNASGDNSVEIIREWMRCNNKNSRVSLICSSDNAGFSAGNNIGLNKTKSKFYLFLNSDTLVQDGAIQIIFDVMSTNKNIGIVTPRLEWPNHIPQESCFHFHSPVSEFISSSQTGFITRGLEKYNVPIPVKDALTMPDWSSFACVLIRKEVFDDIGLMDDGYFMYFEDAEFCYRAKKAGWKIINEPSAHVVHLRGGSSPVKENAKLKKRLPRYYYESRTRYFHQTYGWLGLTLANILWSAGRVISKTRQILGRDDKAVSERQWLDIWTNWFNPLKPYIHPDDYK